MAFVLHYRKLIPLAAFLLFGAVALLLWHHQNDHDRELLVRHIETDVDQVRIRVEGLMNARLASLELMADRWMERQPPNFSRERFQGFATALTRHYPGYSDIFLMDPSGVIQWVFPDDGPVGDISRALAGPAGPGRSSILDSFNKSYDLVVTPCSPFPGKGSYFHALRALRYKNDLQGYLGGSFSVDQVMAICLTKALRNDFAIDVSEENAIIYQQGYPNPESAQKAGAGLLKLPRAVREIRFGSRLWKITLTPKQSSFPIGPIKNAGFLAFGMTLAGSLSLVLYLLIQRMDMYKASRDQAVLEVSERKRAQAALSANEKKLQALLTELTAKNAELESFAYTVSHDLKTPIVTIEGFIGALREDFQDRISAAGDQYLDHMSNAARKMELLINELLNYSRIGRLEGEKTRFAMHEPVQEALTTLQPRIDALGMVVNVPEHLPAVFGNRKRIEQAWNNLLSNAVKYTGRDNAAPRIAIGCLEQDGETVFWIRDNGIGIDAKYFDKIFQIFERLPPALPCGEGTGIGLAIVKRIIEHHGGRIWLASEPGQGTTFYFTIPNQEAQ
jgi:signal transduction histidine kinase